MKNTEECANINFVSVQKSDDEKRKTEFCTQGGFYEQNGAYYVTYKENSQENASTRVFFKIEKDSVTMRRMGEFKTVMQFSEGNMTDFEYNTPFGKIFMKINTTRIVSDFTKKGGILKLEYILFIGEAATKTEITLDIKLRSEEDE